MLVVLVRLIVASLVLNGALLAQTVPDFSAAPTSGVQPLTVHFTNLSTSDALGVFYEWNYGDGEVGLQPFHTYESSGSYSVTLTAYPLPIGDSVSITKTDVITVLPGTLDVDFTASVTSGPAPLQVEFNGIVTGDTTPTALAWDFGDGSGASSEDPTHTFQQAGLYTVSLTASVGDLFVTETKVGVIDVTAPMFEASFDASSSQVAAGFPVSFTDTSISGVPYTRQWDFGDGSEPWYATSSQPAHKYLQPGVYDVSLTISAAGLEDSVSWPGGITVTEVDLDIGIGGAPVSGFAPLVVPFQGLVLGGTPPSSWSWDFGDGPSPWYAVQASPEHIYVEPGVYDVSLTATFGSATASAAAPASVEVLPPELTPGLHVFPRGGLTPLTATFTDTSSAATPQYLMTIDFGDGESTVDSPATHAYAGSGYLSPSQLLRTTPALIAESLELTNGIQVVQKSVVTFSSFAEPVTWTGHPENRFLRAADVNADGLDDLIVEPGTFDASEIFCVYLQTAAGFDAEPVCTRRPDASYSLEDVVGTADPNGDGQLDVVLLNRTLPASLEVLNGDGTGAFDLGFALPLGPGSARWGVLLDVDEDGLLDAVLGLRNGGGLDTRLNIAYSDGQGGFLPPVGPLQVMDLEGQPLVCDLDGDGHLDIVGLEAGAQDSVRYVRGDGAAFGPAQVIPLNGDVKAFVDRPMAVGDLDGDGLVDIVLGSDLGLEVSLGVDGHTALTVADPLPWSRLPTLGDLDGDGDADVMAVRAGRSDGAGSVNLWSGLPLPVGDPQLQQRLLIDVGGDGTLDVVSCYKSSPMLSVHRNLGRIGRWVDIGGEMRGAAGTIRLQGQGELRADTPVTFTLSGAVPGSAAWLVIGFDELMQPFNGGVLVPSPDAVVGGFVTDATGSFASTTRWPGSLPVTTPSWYQAWVGEDAGLVGSNGLLAIAAGD